MSQNPLRGVVPYLVGRTASQEPAWAVVVQVQPLQVRFPTEEGPADVTPLSLVPPERLAPGVKVRCEWMGRTLVVTGRTYGGSAPQDPQPPAWAWPSLLNGWENYTPFGSLRYRREGDIVRLAGVVRRGTTGADTPIATLPPDCWPSGLRLLVGHASAVPVDVRVGTTGALYVISSSVSVSWLTLEGITYSL